MFMLIVNSQCVFVLIHVDDAMIVGVTNMVVQAKKLLGECFTIKDMGPAKYFLGLEIARSPGTLWIGQTKYCKEIISYYGMDDCNPIASPVVANSHLSREDGEPLAANVPYGELVGALLYLTSNTRPDLAYAVGVLSRFVAAPRTAHWLAAKRVLRYLAGTVDHGIAYGTSLGVECFCDADFGGDVDGRRSTSGMCIMVNGGAVVWRAKLQSVVATSTCEAEYISAAEATKEVLWLTKFWAELTGKHQALTLCVDNQAAITLMNKHTAGVSGKTKHIDIAYHFVRHRVMVGDIRVRFVGTQFMVADVMTKGLAGPAHVQAAKGLGVCKRST